MYTAMIQQFFGRSCGPPAPPFRDWHPVWSDLIDDDPVHDPAVTRFRLLARS